MTSWAKLRKFLGKAILFTVLCSFCFVFSIAIHNIVGLSVPICEDIAATLIVAIIALIWTIADIQRAELEKKCAETEKYWRELKEKYDALLKLIEFLKDYRFVEYLSAVSKDLFKEQSEEEDRYIELIRKTSRVEVSSIVNSMLIDDFKKSQGIAEFELGKARSKMQVFKYLLKDNDLSVINPDAPKGCHKNCR